MRLIALPPNNIRARIVVICGGPVERFQPLDRVVDRTRNPDFFRADRLGSGIRTILHCAGIRPCDSSVASDRSGICSGSGAGLESPGAGSARKFNGGATPSHGAGLADHLFDRGDR